MIGAHCAAWILAHGPIPDGLFVLHHCDTRPCVNPSHLFLGTGLDNTLDKVRKGRQAKGERSSTAILRTEDIPTIRRSHDACETLATRFGVTFSTIARIKRRVNWKHVK
jgi:hypothetical protein